MKRVILYLGSTVGEIADYLDDPEKFIEEYLERTPNMQLKKVSEDTSEDTWEGIFKGITIDRPVMLKIADTDLSCPEVKKHLIAQRNKEKREQGKGKSRGRKKLEVVQE